MNASAWGFTVLAIWLILAGAMPLAGVSFTHSGLVLQILMIVSGTLILISSIKSPRRWWS